MNSLFESVYEDLTNGNFNVDEYLTEGKLNQLVMGLKIKPHQDIVTSLKKT